jgi:UTP--glucose-1-phosphate uridylyltransferase
LETQLEGKENNVVYNEIRRISEMANIHFIRQKELKGLGDAIYQSRMHMGNEPFAVLLGDTIVDSAIPVTQQLIDVFEQYRQTIIGVEPVTKEDVTHYGIVGGTQISNTIWEVTELIEKPAIRESPSNLAVAGRYILTPEIFKAIERTPKGKNEEIQLTDALQILLRRESIYSCVIEGKRHDVGNKMGYLKTTVEFALKRKEFAKPFLQFLKEVVASQRKVKKK